MNLQLDVKTKNEKLNRGRKIRRKKTGFKENEKIEKKNSKQNRGGDVKRVYV